MKTITFLKPRQRSVEAGGTEGPKKTTGLAYCMQADAISANPTTQLCQNVQNF